MKNLTSHDGPPLDFTNKKVKNLAGSPKPPKTNFRRIDLNGAQVRQKKPYQGPEGGEEA